MVYFCGFACSEKIQKNARELGVGRGQFHSGVNGLNNLLTSTICSLQEISNLGLALLTLLLLRQYGKGLISHFPLPTSLSAINWLILTKPGDLVLRNYRS